jgi:hypothetical protein
LDSDFDMELCEGKSNRDRTRERNVGQGRVKILGNKPAKLITSSKKCRHTTRAILEEAAAESDLNQPILGAASEPSKISSSHQSSGLQTPSTHGAAKVPNCPHGVARCPVVWITLMISMGAHSMT